MTQHAFLTEPENSPTAGQMIASARGPAANCVALHVLKQLEQAEITYCVLRGGDRLDEDEVDLLVSPRHMRKLGRTLTDLGFIRLRSWGHAPHHFFVTYDANEDRWLKLDVVTRIAYGRPNHALTTHLATHCLQNRQKQNSVFVPSVEDELVTLLLHCVLDKRHFPEPWKRRIARLCEQVRDDEYVSNLLGTHWSIPMSARTLKMLVEQERWDWLLDDRPAVTRRLVGRNPLGTAVRVMSRPILRKLNRVAKLFRPQSLSVALLAPDGAGKSTLAAGISNHFFFPVEQIYMGLYQQGKQARSHWPGFGLASKLCEQWRRYLRARRHRAGDRLVIFDRYTYDARLPARNALSRRQRFRRWLLAHACPAPDLILLLDAPADVLFARKREHDVDYLEQHRQAYIKMLRQFPQMLVLDATKPPDEVRRKAITHIWNCYANRFQRTSGQHVSFTQ